MLGSTTAATRFSCEEWSPESAVGNFPKWYKSYSIKIPSPQVGHPPGGPADGSIQAGGSNAALLMLLPESPRESAARTSARKDW